MNSSPFFNWFIFDLWLINQNIEANDADKIEELFLDRSPKKITLNKQKTHLATETLKSNI